MKPPPAPTIVPNAPTATPKRPNRTALRSRSWKCLAYPVRADESSGDPGIAGEWLPRASDRSCPDHAGRRAMT